MSSDTTNDTIPVIDTHVHIWDRTRPQGAPFPPEILYGEPTPAVKLGDWYRREMTPAGIVGAFAVEASPWVEDNLWLLQACENDTYLVGAIGNLQPETREFAEYLERYHSNPLFLGIRHGNLWGHDIVRQSTQPAFMAGLRRLAQAGLVLEVANPQIDIMDAAVRISDAIPEISVIITHLAGFDPAPELRATYSSILREISQRPGISAKVSYFSIYNPTVPTPVELSFHRDKLDELTDAFGEDRVVAGSFEHRTRSDLVVVREYYATKSRAAAEKFFWRNSLEIYKWTAREENQPGRETSPCSDT